MGVPFEYYNLPDEMLNINVIDEDLMIDVESIIKTAKALGSVVAEEAKIAYIYDRKDYVALDDIAGPSNKAYRSNDDDLVIQVTIRIQNPQSVNSVQALKNILKERKTAAARAQLSAEIERLKEAKIATEKALQKEIDALSKLNAGDFN